MPIVWLYPGHPDQLSCTFIVLEGLCNVRFLAAQTVLVHNAQIIVGLCAGLPRVPEEERGGLSIQTHACARARARAHTHTHFGEISPVTPQTFFLVEVVCRDFVVLKSLGKIVCRTHFVDGALVQASLVPECESVSGLRMGGAK